MMLNELKERGYMVKENGAVYYTENMDQTMEWFRKVLGWYSQVDFRNENNEGMYGSVNNIPIEVDELHLGPYTGMHMFYGEPIKRMIGFMQVEGIEKLYSYVKKQGWNQITEVMTEPWGGKKCEITTIDGSIITFFELV